MAMLVLGDSNVERVWLNVRNNRELLRSAVFTAVKRFDQLQSGYQSMLPTVRICYHLVMLGDDLMVMVRTFIALVRALYFSIV